MRNALKTVVLVLVLARSACIHQNAPPAAPAPPPHVIEMMGYDEAVSLGTAYAQQMGYPGPRLELAEPMGNVWRVRFGLGPASEGRRLVLQFDSTSRKLVKTEELGGVGAKALTPPPPSER
jgi:hypothetical protein